MFLVLCCLVFVHIVLSCLQVSVCVFQLLFEVVFMCSFFMCLFLFPIVSVLFFSYCYFFLIFCSTIWLLIQCCFRSIRWCPWGEFIQNMHATIPNMFFDSTSFRASVPPWNMQARCLVKRSSKRSIWTCFFRIVDHCSWLGLKKLHFFWFSPSDHYGLRALRFECWWTWLVAEDWVPKPGKLSRSVGFSLGWGCCRS